jgi:RNA polymerase sigma-70 factor (ECF subfamily)
MPSDYFEQIVTQYYEALYRFAFGLTRTQAGAGDLTQETFYIWSTKGHQLRDRSKVKSWLFTVLHREFLKIQKKATRFPHFELSEENEDLPAVSPEMVSQLDADLVLEHLGQIRRKPRKVEVAVALARRGAD